MEKINLCEGVVAQMMDTEAWSNISCNFPFSDAQLEKFSDKLNWENVSRNINIGWTISMLEKYKKKLDWTVLSLNINVDVLSVDLIDKFKDKWNWEKLSENINITLEIIERFADYINWKALINHWCCEEWASEDFVKKYSDRIPACEFKNSRLWEEIVTNREKDIKKQICLG